jgi:hypothetical protein
MVTLWATLKAAAHSFGARVYQTAALIRTFHLKKYNYFNELFKSLSENDPV